MKNKKQTIIPPEGGWKEQTYYLVEASCFENNPIHHAIFYSGFLNNRDGTPSGYNGVISYGEDKPRPISELRYLRVVRALISSEECKKMCANLHRLPREVEASKEPVNKDQAMNKWKDKTRGGYHVRIYAEDGVGKYPIHGAINYGEGWEANTWTSEGALEVGGVFSERDLIPTTPTTPIIDWSKQPDWCKAVAMNEDGRWWRYGKPPIKTHVMWIEELGNPFLMHPSEYPAFDGKWEDSLCVRPEGGAQ